MASGSRSRIRIHWAWLPAGVFGVAVAIHRWGWLAALGIVAAGLALAGYAEWRAARRRRD